MDEIREENYPYREIAGEIVDSQGFRWDVPGNVGIAQLLNTICEQRIELRRLQLALKARG